MPDWVIAIAVVIGTLLGVGIQEFRRWRESRERYQVMTFPKCLEVHQKAFSWCHQLYAVLVDGNAKDIRRIAQTGRVWWNDNCFFLDTDSRQKMIALFNAASVYADGIEGRPGNLHPGKSIWQYVNEALKAITEGVGHKYLPETSTTEVPEREGKENDQRGKSTVKNTWQKLNRSFSANPRYLQILFVAGIAVFVGLVVTIMLRLPTTEAVTTSMKGSFICGSVGPTIALVVAYFEVKNMRAKLALTIAIDIILAGMIFQLVGFFT